MGYDKRYLNPLPIDHHCIYRINPHTAYQHQTRMKTKIRHAMACRYIDLSCPWVFRIDPHAAMQHQMTMKTPI